MTTTERKLVMIARRLGCDKYHHPVRVGPSITVWGGVSTRDFDLRCELRAVLLEEHGVRVRRCDDCGAATHDTGSTGCPQFEWARS